MASSNAKTKRKLVSNQKVTRAPKRVTAVPGELSTFPLGEFKAPVKGSMRKLFGNQIYETSEKNDKGTPKRLPRSSRTGKHLEKDLPEVPSELSNRQPDSSPNKYSEPLSHSQKEDKPKVPGITNEPLIFTKGSDISAEQIEETILDPVESKENIDTDNDQTEEEPEVHMKSVRKDGVEDENDQFLPGSSEMNKLSSSGSYVDTNVELLAKSSQESPIPLEESNQNVSQSKKSIKESGISPKKCRKFVSGFGPKSKVKSKDVVSNAQSSGTIKTSVDDLVARVIGIASESYNDAKPFLQGDLPWQIGTTRCLEFFQTLDIPFHPTPTVSTQKVPKKGAGTAEDPGLVLSDTEDEAQEEDCPIDEIDPHEQAPEYTLPTMEERSNYLENQIESIRRKRKQNYTERMKVAETGETIPDSIFALEYEQVPPHEVVTAFLDSEVVNDETNYQVVLRRFQGRKMLEQVTRWLPSKDPLIKERSGLLRAYRRITEFTGQSAGEKLNDTWKMEILAHSVGVFTANDISDQTALSKAFYVLIKYEPDLERIQGNDDALMTVLQSPGEAYYALQTSKSDFDLSEIYIALGLAVNRVSGHRKLIAAQLSMLVEIMSRALQEKKIKPTQAKNAARAFLRPTADVDPMEEEEEYPATQQTQNTKKIKRPPTRPDIRKKWSLEKRAYLLYRGFQDVIFLDDFDIAAFDAVSIPNVERIIEIVHKMGHGDKFKVETHASSFSLDKMLRRIHNHLAEKYNYTKTLEDFQLWAKQSSQKLKIGAVTDSDTDAH